MAKDITIISPAVEAIITITEGINFNLLLNKTTGEVRLDITKTNLALPEDVVQLVCMMASLNSLTKEMAVVQGKAIKTPNDYYRFRDLEKFQKPLGLFINDIAARIINTPEILEPYLKEKFPSANNDAHLEIAELSVNRIV